MAAMVPSTNKTSLDDRIGIVEQEPSAGKGRVAEINVRSGAAHTVLTRLMATCRSGGNLIARS